MTLSGRLAQCLKMSWGSEETAQLPRADGQLGPAVDVLRSANGGRRRKSQKAEQQTFGIKERAIPLLVPLHISGANRQGG
jgi:hypothetical protein